MSKDRQALAAAAKRLVIEVALAQDRQTLAVVRGDGALFVEACAKAVAACYAAIDALASPAGEAVEEQPT